MDETQIKDKLKELNAMTAQFGLGKIDIVDPRSLKAQKVNARYFTPEKFQQLVSNIKQTGSLESLPLVMEKKGGGYEIISGHHRIESAVEAGLEVIMVMVSPTMTRDELVSKQLSHNALVGIDDMQVLNQLFQSIGTIEWKIASGLADEIGKIEYDSLNFRLGNFKEIMIMFLPEEEEGTDAVLELIATESLSKTQQTVYLTQKNYYARFGKVLRKIKKIENIKSNGVAFLRMIELAEKQHRHEEERKETA